MSKSTFHIPVPTPSTLRRAFLFLLIPLVIVAAAFAVKAPTASEPSAVDGLPHSAQSWIAAQRAATLPQPLSQPAFIVFTTSKNAGLTSTDRATIIGETNAYLLAIERTKPVSASFVLRPLVENPTRTVAYLTVSIASKPSDSVVSDRVLALRAALKHGLPAGVTAYVTGPPAFSTDLGQVFNGANTTLLLTTVLIVALLLLLTYRSPLLWLIPLLVVGIADQVSAQVAAVVAPHVGIHLDGASTGIAEVLVFGAGTDYALLLIARYRDQLRREQNRFVAMATAVRLTTEAIVASGATVTMSLALLLLASLHSTQALGFTGSIGIVLAMVFALLVLPTALVLVGRRAFWPLIPKVGDERHEEGKIFGRVGDFVARRAKPVALVSVVLLVVAGTLGLGSRSGLTTTQQFTATPESVIGQNILSQAFPQGSSNVATVLTSPSSLATVVSTMRMVPGVTSVSSGVSTSQWAEVTATLSAVSGSSSAFATITALRHAVAGVAGAKAVVGGDDAITLDTTTFTSHDQGLITPLILLVVAGVLLLLLRSLVAALLLLLTVGMSYFAALGISWVIFQHVDHFAALGTGTAFYGFLFLVALGVDYNIFLTTRAREETAAMGTAPAMLRALRSTGGVITSAGILLASVFAVLGVLPLIQLTQIGTIVCVGVLLDTLLVRTVLVPALTVIADRKFWWPSSLAK